MRGLYLVTDRRLCKDKSVEEIVLQAVKGGVSYVQLREKEMSTHDFVEEALRIKKSLTPHKVPLIINDRVDVALPAAPTAFISDRRICLMTWRADCWDPKRSSVFP